MTTLIQAEGLQAGYDGVAVVRDLDIRVEPGELVVLLGPNGAGKTTTLLTLAGELPPIGGVVRWHGRESAVPLYRRARDGLAFVTEERSVFMGLTVEQNLRVGRCDVERALSVFPELRPLLSRRAGLCSGGEQQMLSLARALSRPTSLLLADELSLGLAPRSTGRLLRAVRDFVDGGAGALLVEQHVHRVLAIADRAYLLRGGRVEFSGTSAEARAMLPEIERYYLSAGEGAGDDVVSTDLADTH